MKNIDPVVQQLIAIRKSKGLTQTAVARRMHVDHSMVSYLERGKGTPWLSTLQRYAEAIGAKITVDAA